jgi:type I site-specific restriction-modification system R (restriction) subunit
MESFRLHEHQFRASSDAHALIVVDTLLTGFDAPSATFLCIHKQMRDHGLFQAM